jgi:hypothetical protein
MIRDASKSNRAVTLILDGVDIYLHTMFHLNFVHVRQADRCRAERDPTILAKFFSETSSHFVQPATTASTLRKSVLEHAKRTIRCFGACGNKKQRTIYWIRVHYHRTQCRFCCLGKWPRIDDNHGPCLHHRRSGHRNQEKRGRTCQHVESEEEKNGQRLADFLIFVFLFFLFRF